MKPSSTKGPSNTTMYSTLRPTAMQLRQERGGPRQAMHPRKASLPLACRAVTTRFAKDISLTSTEEATRPQQRNAPFIAIDGSSSSQYVDAQNVYARLCQPAAQAGRMPTAAYPHHVLSSTRPASGSKPDAPGSPRAAAPTAAPHSQAADSFPEDVSCMAAIDESFFMYNDLAGQPDLPRPPRYRSPLMSVVSAALISPLYPDNHASDTAMLNKSSSTSILARSQLGQQAAVQVMRDITTQQDNILSQASRAVATATRLAQTIPTAGAAAVKAVADAAAASLTSPAGPLGLKAVVAGVTEQWSDDLARLQQAAVALQSRGSTLQDLEAKVAALQAERDSLSVQLQETNRRAQFAESVAAGMTARLDDKRALSTLDDAMQVFRRHIASVPADLAPSMFIEQPDDIIGKGGCATVYKWRVGATDWAVKSDPISHRNQSAQEFDPQRCGDLLPAFLPPHANIMAPRAWWVGPLAPPAPQQPTNTLAKPLTAASGFKLYTLYEKYSCSLWDHMQLLHSIKFPQEQQQQESDFTVRGKEAKSGVCSPAGLPGSSDALLLDLRSLLTIVRDVAAALEHLARHRVVHGDVKMENVLLVLHPETAAAQPKRVARAVLIDFGLCAMMPQGVEKLKARGGTWLFKAPEQMSGPSGMCLGGQERSANPHVELQTDVWALGALIAMLCNNGVLPSKPGLPFGVPPEQLLKWGDRPKGGSMEPFYMTWDEVLPKLPGSMGAIKAEPMPVGCAVTESAAAVQYAHVMALLRRLAQGCMQVQPSQRLSAGQVRAAAAEALSQLC